jgi:hyperosmotically inducible periplasmic protein
MEKPMKTFNPHYVLALLFVLSPFGSVARAQNAPATWSEADTTRIVKDVQKKVSGLTDYGVFDDLHFAIKGKTLVLQGYASRPSLKSSAANALKNIAGVESVDNQIEVLPLSNNDDHIRAAVYNKIFLSPALRRYNANAGSAFRGLSVARMAGGITVDPPIGFHAIHIIVKNGNVILRGAVLNQGDANIAQIQANSAFGVFSVTNELGIEGASQSKK